MPSSSAFTGPRINPPEPSSFRFCSSSTMEEGNGSADVTGNGSDDEASKAELLVKQTLRKFNTLYLHYVQLEEKRCKEIEAKAAASKPSKSKGENVLDKAVSKKRKNSKSKVLKESSDTKKGSNGSKYGKTEDKVDAKRGSKRPDLKAVSEMLNNRDVLYPEKTIGHLKGIRVGHQFFSRCEMVAVGLHSHWLNGIDYMGQKFKKVEKYKDYNFPLAVAIVVSGQYEDDLDNANDLVYTGQGGNDLLGSKRQTADQKMERGNLALKNSWVYKLPVRVIRGHESGSSYTGKVYTYDGLYVIVDHWTEKGTAGFTIFRFRLRRLKGQPPLTTSQVNFSRSQRSTSLSTIRGLVCEDISEGQERFPIVATNVIDVPPVAPSGFQYRKSLQISESTKLPSNARGCKCRGRCYDPRFCSCARLNGTDFPYVSKDGGRLIEAKAVVYECGPDCSCDEDCVNRTSQQGLRYRLEVFKTPSKGWAVRSWDTIPSGAPVCEYTGILKSTKDVGNAVDNNYIFDIDCLQTMNGIDGREKRPGEVAVLKNFSKDELDSPEFCIDAGIVGNIARFINHSCQPNLFVQCVLSSHHDIRLAKIMLFAADTIPPLQELAYDYGYVLDSVVVDGATRKLDCHCGAATCRKRMY